MNKKANNECVTPVKYNFSPSFTPGKVEATIYRKLQKGPLHFTLIDPEKQSAKDAMHLAKAAMNAGSDALLIGGSTLENTATLHESVALIKKHCPLPVILFPGASKQMSPLADAILFMSLLNSQEPRFLIGEQMQAAPIIAKLNIEPIAMGYLVFAPGGAVGRVGKAKLVPPDDYKTALAYALAAEMFGMRFIYLEAGSGASAPISLPLIRHVRRAISLPIIVGGGIRDAHTAYEIIKAGANIVVTGTLIESAKNPELTLTSFLHTLQQLIHPI